jgi:deoxyadenosine/deoxycytidine kinase
LLVEIVGTAGAGKTTLIQGLSRSSKHIQAIYHFGSFRSLPTYVGAALSLLPTYLSEQRQGKQYTWQEIKWMVRLLASYQIACRQKADENVVTLIDQGPIYTLARLLDRQCTDTKGPEFIQWWREMLEKWAGILDIVIWLDAPIDLLRQRVYTRAKRHAAKELNEQEASEMLSKMQTSFVETLAALNKDGRPAVISWDTSLFSAEEIIEQTLQTLKLERDLFPA